MPLPVSNRVVTVRSWRRRAAVILAVSLAIGPVVAACGDDGRVVGAAHRLIIEPCQGRLDQRATGAPIAPNLVATVAHSLEGVRRIEMQGDGGRNQEAELVYLDQDKDIALLRPQRPLGDHLTLSSPEGPGPVGVVRFDDATARSVVDDGEILELVDVTLDGDGRRAAARLSAAIEPGDSGAPVIDDGGLMVAMVFATARGSDVGWAVSATELLAAVDALDRDGPGPEPPSC